MKRALTGVALLAGAWLFASGYYHHPDPWSWGVWAFLLLSGAALLGDSKAAGPTRIESLAAAVMLAPAIWLAPWPGRAGPVLLAAGLAAWAIPSLPRWLRWVRSSALAAGGVLLAQSMGMYLYEVLTARSHELPRPIAWLLTTIAGSLGINAALTPDAIALFSMRQTHMLAPSWELLLDPATACFLAGTTALLALRAITASCTKWNLAKGLIGLLAAVLIWLPIRAGLLMALYLHRVLRTSFEEPLNVVSMFWSPELHLLLLAGVTLLAWRLVRTPPQAPLPESSAAAPTPSDWRRFVWPAAAALAAALLTLAPLLDPPGARRGGRLLVDEHHSQWERTDKPMDTNWYGHMSGYNYACIYDYLSRFYDIARQNEPLTDGRLQNVDVLVLKTPTARYSPAEVAAIERFVDKGGGLILIGEHTDVFGTGTFLNDVARTFGFAFRFDCLFDVDRTFDQTWVPGLVKHPVVQHIPTLEFAVSCSIDPGASAGRAVIRSAGLKSLPAEYHASNFYPVVENRPDMRYGAFIQLWAARHGEGRVVAFTDSTIFSNFAAFEPGKPQLLLGMIEWANRHNGPSLLWLWLAMAGVAAIAAGSILARGRRAGWAVTFAAAALGWAAAILAARGINHYAMPLPTNVRPMIQVAIDRAVCSGPLSKAGFIAGDPAGFGIFERWILRLGYFTERRDEVPGPECQLYVLPFPTAPITDAFRARIRDYVDRGGHLLVIDGPENARSTADALLRPFDLKVDRSAPLAGPLAPPGAQPAATTRPATGPSPQTLESVLAAVPAIPAPAAFGVTGGTPLVALQGKPVAATVRYGKGTVTAVGFGGLFTDVNMGVTGDVEPNAALRRVFDLQFSLLRRIVRGVGGN